jgi:hypothetical protein
VLTVLVDQAEWMVVGRTVGTGGLGDVERAGGCGTGRCGGQRAGWIAGTSRRAERPRSRHGRRYGLAGVLVIAAAAVLAGARSYVAIAEFTREGPQQTLTRLGIWQRPHSNWYVAPASGRCAGCFSTSTRTSWTGW